METQQLPQQQPKNRAKLTVQPSLLSEEDVHLFNEGNHFRLYEKLGAQLQEGKGAYFTVWAPNAEKVSVVGDFNGWRETANRMRQRGVSGLWETFVPGVKAGDLYKFHIASRGGTFIANKADPFAFYAETAPKTASVAWPLTYSWRDEDWMQGRRAKNSLDAPMATYEVHLGSWMRGPTGESLSYREMAPRLAAYVKDAGFTHVELMPILEHPFYGSWGYLVTGYFAATGRYGTPQDFMYLIDVLHQNNIGVILDWVPSHFPGDAFALGRFDGTHLYEHADPRKGFHPDWNSYIFNYGRNEVRSFLISNALFWLDKYHIDALRVDAVASMLYLDYSRKEGEWLPNEFGGRENVDAIHFLRTFNEQVYKNYPDVQTIAEESTAWPMVSRPVYLGGLGFGLKWDMGWMHDTLQYFSKDPIYRSHHQNQLTFRMVYAFNENFVLALSHDEVVYGKGSLYEKMPGDPWQKCANLRLLFAYMYLLPGKKLLFMGDEFGQTHEWSHEANLTWTEMSEPLHAGVFAAVRDLNRLYRNEPVLYAREFTPETFAWVDTTDAANSALSFLRLSADKDSAILAAFNFTPTPLYNYRIGVPALGLWREVFNSDAKDYGGSGHGNFGGVDASPLPCHGRPHSLSLTLPPLGAVVFKYQAPQAKQP